MKCRKASRVRVAHTTSVSAMQVAVRMLQASSKAPGRKTARRSALCFMVVVVDRLSLFRTCSLFPS